MMSQTTICNLYKCKKGEVKQIDGVAKMMVVLTHKEMSYLLVGLFDDLVAPVFILIFVI